MKPTISELNQLRVDFNIPLALDEYFYQENPRFLSLDSFQEIVDVIVLKPTMIGGFKHCKTLISELKQRSFRVVLTSSLENIVSLHSLSAIASAWLDKNEFFGLNTFDLFSESDNYPSLVENNKFQTKICSDIINSKKLPGIKNSI